MQALIPVFHACEYFGVNLAVRVYTQHMRSTGDVMMHAGCNTGVLNAG